MVRFKANIRQTLWQTNNYPVTALDSSTRQFWIGSMLASRKKRLLVPSTNSLYKIYRSRIQSASQRFMVSCVEIGQYPLLMAAELSIENGGVPLGSHIISPL
jgi:hypothetical protein